MELSGVLGLGQTALELGLLCSLVTLALFLSYTMLGVCDLSTDGCFTLGAAVGAVTALAGHPLLAPVAAMAAGMASGFVTALLQTKLGVESLLAGIIVNTGLYSVNIAVMGGASLLSLNKAETVFSLLRDTLAGTPLAGLHKLLAALLAVGGVVLFQVWFLRTRLGLALRATGDNRDMVRTSAIDPDFPTIVGLCLSGAITGLAGCLLTQYQKVMSIDVGSGMVTIALASLLIGRVLLRGGSIPRQAGSIVAGSVLFRLAYTLAIQLHMPAFMLKLISALIVALAVAGPYLAAQRRSRRRHQTERGGSPVC